MKLRFTDTAINALSTRTKRLELTDCGCPGLVLRVTTKGVKTFRYVARSPHGGFTRVTLGHHPKLTVAGARAMVETLRDSASAERLRRRSKGLLRGSYRGPAFERDEQVDNLLRSREMTPLDSKGKSRALAKCEPGVISPRPGLRPLMTERQILELLPISRSTLQNWVSQGHFPRHIGLGPRRNAWFVDEVMEWQNSRQR